MADPDDVAAGRASPLCLSTLPLAAGQSATLPLPLRCVLMLPQPAKGQPRNRSLETRGGPAGPHPHLHAGARRSDLGAGSREASTPPVRPPPPIPLQSSPKLFCRRQRCATSPRNYSANGFVTTAMVSQHRRAEPSKLTAATRLCLPREPRGVPGGANQWCCSSLNMVLRTEFC